MEAIIVMQQPYLTDPCLQEKGRYYACLDVPVVFLRCLIIVQTTAWMRIGQLANVRLSTRFLFQLPIYTNLGNFYLIFSVILFLYHSLAHILKSEFYRLQNGIRSVYKAGTRNSLSSIITAVSYLSMQ